MRKFFLLTVFLLLFVAGCEGLPTDLERGQFQSPPPPQQPVLQPTPEGYTEGRIVIQPTPTMENEDRSVLQSSPQVEEKPTHAEIKPQQSKTKTTTKDYPFPWEWLFGITLATVIGFFGGVAVGADFAENCKNRR